MGGGSHQAGSSSNAGPDTTTERYYWAQCVKDETMAESIVSALEKQGGKPGVVVHVTGAFHSDYGDGTGARVSRRLAGRRLAIVSMIPIESLDTVAPATGDLKRADFLVYTIK